jgi:hypothetical protein
MGVANTHGHEAWSKSALRDEGGVGISGESPSLGACSPHPPSSPDNGYRPLGLLLRCDSSDEWGSIEHGRDCQGLPASGVGTLCDSLEGRVRTLNYRTIRYPGHAAIMRALLNDLRLLRRLQSHAERVSLTLPDDAPFHIAEAARCTQLAVRYSTISRHGATT